MPRNSYHGNHENFSTAALTDNPFTPKCNLHRNVNQHLNFLENAQFYEISRFSSLYIAIMEIVNDAA